MAEKILNTRILNKIDTLEAWNSSTLKIKQGEICLATVAASAGTGLSEPVIMAKIGTSEEKTFAELPWAFHAKASDVLSACKTEAGLTAFINNVIAGAGIATNDALTALSGKVATAEGDIDALEGLVGEKAVATQISEAIAALNLANTYDAKGAAADALADAKEYADGKDSAMNTRVAALELIDHEHANAGVLDGITAEKVAAWDAAEQNAKDHADDLDEAMDGRVAALEALFEDGEGSVADQIADAVAAEAGLREAADTALSNRVKTIEDDYLKNADKVALQDQITANDGDIAGLKGLVGDTAVATQISTAVAAEAEIARAAEKANADAIDILNGNAETEGSVDYKIAEKFASLMDNPDEAMNSIQELVDWTTEHAEDALEMSNQVTANKNAIATLNGDASTAGSVDKKIADAIAAENLSQYATDGELTTLAGRVTTVEGAVATKAESADLNTLAGRVTTVENDLNTETTGLKAKMAAAESDIDDLETKVGEKTVATQISEAIAALAIGDYAKAADLTAAVNRITTAEGKITTLEGKAHEHENKTVLDGITSEKVAAWDKVSEKANTADLHAIATSGNVNDLVQTTGDVLVFDCGTSAV